jgi:hypothetical protein
MEYIEKKYNNNKTDDIFSERFTYYTTRADVLGWGTEDTGAYVRDTIRSLINYGTCLEGEFPYNEDYRTKPSEQNYSDAKKHQVVAYARFKDGNSRPERKNILKDIKLNLEAGFPILIRFICFSNIWSEVG